MIRFLSVTALLALACSTAEAARKPNVLLIVSDDPDDRRTAWFGPGPSQISAEAAVLRSLGAEPVVEARLVDVAVRGALRTGAGILVLPGGEGPDEGLGAILRWGTRP